MVEPWRDWGGAIIAAPHITIAPILPSVSSPGSFRGCYAQTRASSRGTRSPACTPPQLGLVVATLVGRGWQSLRAKSVVRSLGCPPDKQGISVSVVSVAYVANNAGSRARPGFACLKRCCPAFGAIWLPPRASTAFVHAHQAACLRSSSPPDPVRARRRGNKCVVLANCFQVVSWGEGTARQESRNCSARSRVVVGGSPFHPALLNPVDLLIRVSTSHLPPAGRVGLGPTSSVSGVLSHRRSAAVRRSRRNACPLCARKTVRRGMRESPFSRACASASKACIPQPGVATYQTAPSRR